MQIIMYQARIKGVEAQMRATQGMIGAFQSAIDANCDLTKSNDSATQKMREQEKDT